MLYELVHPGMPHLYVDAGQVSSSVYTAYPGVTAEIDVEGNKNIARKYSQQWSCLPAQNLKTLNCAGEQVLIYKK